MAKFEWHTEDEHSWDDEPQAREPQGNNRRRRFMIFGVLLLLVGGASALIFQQIRQTVDEARAQTEAELEATVKLFNTAAASSDIDIVTSLLSGSDDRWAMGYQLRVGESNLLDRSAMNMALVSAEPTHIDILLSPDLFSAEITTTLPYAIDIGNGLTQTILLQQPQLFRRGETRWLLSPQPITYWGNQMLRDTAFGTVKFYERDRVLLERLLAEMTLAYSQICAADAGYCNTNGVIIEFSNDPRLSLHALPPLSFDVSTTAIQLPTPTLVGLPVDQASYDALLAGYMQLIARHALARPLAGLSSCCDQWLYFDATVELLLIDAGFIPNSVSTNLYALALDYADPLYMNFAFTQSLGYSYPELISTRIWLDYLLATYPSQTKLSLLRSFADQPEMAGWLHTFALADNPVAAQLAPRQFAEQQLRDYREYLLNKLPLEANASPPFVQTQTRSSMQATR